MNTQRPQLAAITGRFAGFALIKTRDTAQFVIEVNGEDADAALAALGGLPRPGVDRWVAVALLKSKPDERASANGKPPEFESGNEGSTPSARANAEKKRVPWDTMKLAAQAGVLCADRNFQMWLRGAKPGTWSVAIDTLDAPDTSPPTDEDITAQMVRVLCDVSTRRDLDIDEAAGRKWSRLVTEFRAATGQMAQDYGR